MLTSSDSIGDTIDSPYICSNGFIISSSFSILSSKSCIEYAFAMLLSGTIISPFSINLLILPVTWSYVSSGN